MATLRVVSKNTEETEPATGTESDGIGMIWDDTSLEAEVVSFINEYQTKELHELDKPAVVLSKLRALYKIYNAKMSRTESITDGMLTKHGIQKGMLLNIEKKFLRMAGQQWTDHYIQTYGPKSLRSAQDYMALGRIPKIIDYAVIGKERLMKSWRAIKLLEIESDDPMATFLEKYNIPFNPEDLHNEEAMMDLKSGIDSAVAFTKIEKAEQRNGSELGVNPDLFKKMIELGMKVDSGLINDLFIINKENRDVTRHLESLCGNGGDGDEMLPHIKKLNALPNLIAGLKETVESITKHSALAGRVEQDSIDDLENCVADLKNLVGN